MPFRSDPDDAAVAEVFGDVAGRLLDVHLGLAGGLAGGLWDGRGDVLHLGLVLARGGEGQRTAQDGGGDRVAGAHG